MSEKISLDSSVVSIIVMVYFLHFLLVGELRMKLLWKMRTGCLI